MHGEEFLSRIPIALNCPLVGLSNFEIFITEQDDIICIFGEVFIMLRKRLLFKCRFI